jgi:flagellar motor protein MotB
VIVEGHADTSEGSSERIWSLSLERAKEAVVILNQSDLSPRLIEASGRGCWEPAKGADKVDSHTASEMNRRLEIVVVYAGPQSIDHINLKSKQERRH